MFHERTSFSANAPDILNCHGQPGYQEEVGRPHVAVALERAGRNREDGAAMPFVQAALFDFGGVFMASPFAAVRDFGTKRGIGPDRVLELIFGAYDSDTDHPWHRLERGELSLTDAREAILALGEPDHRIDLFEALGALTRATIRADVDRRRA